MSDYCLKTIKFKNGVVFQGLWCFCSPKFSEREECEIVGEKGSVKFTFYGDSVETMIDGEIKVLKFEFPEHIQQPMIERVCRFFEGDGPNPCTGEEGTRVIEIMNSFIS